MAMITYNINTNGGTQTTMQRYVSRMRWGDRSEVG